MVEAYVLINVEPASTAQAKSELLKIPEVKRADMVTGGVDIVAIIEAGSIAELRDVVAKKIRGIKGIVKTETMIVL